MVTSIVNIKQKQLKKTQHLDLNCVSAEFRKAILQKINYCYFKWLTARLVLINQMLIIARLLLVNFRKLQLRGLSHMWEMKFWRRKQMGWWKDEKRTQCNSVQRKWKDPGGLRAHPLMQDADSQIQIATKVTTVSGSGEGASRDKKSENEDFISGQSVARNKGQMY